MNDKEFNRAILGKLYEIAHKVFDEGVNVPSGSYTASELLKEQKQVEKIGKRFFKENYNCECCESIAVDNFQCSFSLERIFALVSKFEKLAGISAKEKRVFTAKSDTGNVLASFDVVINKGLGTLAKFVKKDGLNQTLQYVCLDVEDHNAVATDGQTLQMKPLAVPDGSTWNGALGRRYPLIEASAWKKMCALAGKGAKLTCNLVGDDMSGGCRWISTCKGVVSTVEAFQNPNYMSVISTVDASKVARLDKKAWNAAKRWIKGACAIDDTLIIKHEEGSKEIIFMLQAEYNSYCTMNFACETTPYEGFTLGVKASTAVSVIDSFSLYVPKCATRPLYFIEDGDIKMVMPTNLDGESYNLEMMDKTSAFKAAKFDGGANKPAQATESAKAVNRTPEQKETHTEQKNAPIKKEAGTASKTTLDAGLKKFTFAKVGVNVGDVLTFVDGTEVLAAEDNKVSFCGELFTLSGFCKEFMPDERRTKSNSYRGCDYFYKDGVKLGKLLKEYQKNVASVLDSTPSEQEQTEETTAKVISLPVRAFETSEQVITPSAKDIATERKELVQSANNMVCDVGILAKVVAISLGVPPECGVVASGIHPINEPPNKGVRLVGVGSKLFVCDVGSCIGVAGKVVHTLPLPPPVKKQEWR